MGEAQTDRGNVASNGHGLEGQTLRTLASDGAATLYEIAGSHETAVSRYVATTPESRRIVNQPELMGVSFSRALARAVTRVLGLLPERAALEATAEEQVCVVHFLRGGLNFGLREALHDAFGLDHHTACFMSSQRRRVDGRWFVEEDMYRKLDIPAGAVLLVGDVVATGVTAENGLEVILEHLRRIESSLRRLVFFTIGCHKLEKILARFDAACRREFPEYEGSAAVYLEGKFRLVDSKTELEIGIPGTDLVRFGALLPPELVRSQYEDPAHPLERCTIYDAGSRAFDVPTYVADVREYWTEVAALADRGWSLADARRERWPEPWIDDREAFLATWRASWPDVETTTLDTLWSAIQDAWTPERRARAEHPEALAALARRRLDDLPRFRT